MGYSRKIGRRDFLKLAGGGLAGAMMLGVAGCGGGGGGGQGGGESGPIRIGALLTLSGPYATLGESIRNGMETFLRLNDNQIGGREVEVRYEDSEGDPQVALRVYRQLTGQNAVDFLMGPVISTEALALANRLQRDRIILINSNAAANDLSWGQKSDYSYRVSQSNYQLGAAGAPYIFENIGKRAFAIGMDYVAGYEVIEAFRIAYQEAGGEVVGSAFSAPGTADFATYLTNIRRAEPEVVFSFLSGTDAIRFIQQYDSFGLKGEIPLIGHDQLASPTVTDPAGEAAEGVMAISFYYPNLENETNRRFVEAYRNEYDQSPDTIACQGYDTGNVIARAVEEAGSTEPDALIEVLRGISVDSPRGSFTIDPETNNPVQNYYVGENVREGGSMGVRIIDTIEDVGMPAEPPEGYNPTGG
ncbi:hypothetical protein Rxycam_02253 [Rubrobacter xylanophilus DSM 9941]|uniref:ABC transporter substrate-binding protein n=1 Tax=Rubrobacter xylanophilus TaxID=49319 RepID=UPI001C6423C0|nr:ABC transporter substrate-binding protein [Rubrobacter xylanophilus]QYJ16420.1 hypothetical protein Rxycam_02253 [Rubrobacter xylanophilus DSM 9941]